ncbi:hypothetical protein [Solimicrobium silvestre]|uniref:Lipoprotein n=1 Tax=Solimicrobium silvestre TaxID=2099400 RepID=A0A2S9GWU6_9BURK|nr:hypothetical protein [Solimicrobium silvestre]PRC92192.1 hypothetical protein S2091_3108 [Solimicrobium silvestre]
MNWFKRASAVLLVSLCSACANSPPVIDTNVTINFPEVAPIVSVEQADAALEAVALSRAQIDWRFRQKEQICYTKFFMNHCMLEAKEQRRIDLATVKKSEVAANYFKRKNNVEEMDRALVEKNLAHPLPGTTPNDDAENKSDKPATTDLVKKPVN